MQNTKPSAKHGELKVVGVALRRLAPSASGDTLELSVEVKNTGHRHLYVWVGRRAYDYNASTRVLSVHLAEPPESAPANIRMLSDHVHTPPQIAVEAHSGVTIEVGVPAFTRGFTPGQGLGRSFVEDPIGDVKQVQIHVQYAPVPIQFRTGERPSAFRARLRAHGDVVTAALEPTLEKEK
jgi:hypothetical protein